MTTAGDVQTKYCARCGEPEHGTAGCETTSAAQRWLAAIEADARYWRAEMRRASEYWRGWSDKAP